MAKQIGDILVEKKLVTPEELQRALAEQEKTGEFLGSILIRMGCISEEQLLQSLSEQLNIPFVNLKDLTIDQAVIQRVPARLVEHYKVMPVRWERDVLTIAVSNLHRYTWALEDSGLHLGCAVQPVIVSRINITAHIDIAERRVPQDRRIKSRVGERGLHLRISIPPSAYRKHVVIRIPSAEMLYSLELLGLLPEDLEIIQRIIREPHGMILVTGPTGSGKTTTLYASLTKLNTRQRKIITVEDPIEYEPRGITQIQVNPKVNVTFANALRSMLRDDPDIMMVGEIRDLETAKVAVQAAFTGHLVFSTLHTDDAAGGLSRLMHMGIPPYLITSAATAFIAQRLVRLICAECRHEVSDPTTTRILVGGEPIPAYRGKGCEACRFTGYHGRTGIYEILTVNDRIKELIMERASSDILKKEAIRVGMKTLFRDGLKKVAAGLTTSEEVLMTTQADG